METDRWQRLLSVFDDALEVAAEARPSFVRSRCEGDEGLALEVERMLEAHNSDERFMARPAFAPSEDLLETPAQASPAFGYRVIRALGSGGMGMVYLAEQLATGREVALKVVGPWAASESVLRRFEYEVRTLAQLQHPAIAQMYEAGSLPEAEGRRPFFAMEYVYGRPLLQYAPETKLDVDAKLRLFIRVCTGVQHAHQKGVIHRDLKPANVLVTAAGDPKILDFGVARAVGDDQGLSSLHTREGQLIGTLAYMSPEQVSGKPEGLDTRSDVYALGVILHELLTGRPPYDIGSKGLAEAARIIREESPSRPSSIDRSFRGDLDVIVSKCLEKERDRRYGSVAELSADVQRYLNDEPIIARPASAWYQIGKFARRNRIAVASIVIVLIAMVLGIAGTSWQAVLATRARNDTFLAKIQADKRQQEARAQAAAAEAVVEFIRRVFDSVDPGLRGKDAKVLDLLADADQRLDHEFSSQPEAWSTLRNTLGSSYLALAQYDDAEREAKLVLNRPAKEGAISKCQVAIARNTIALVRSAQGKYEEALKMLQEDVAEIRASGAPASHDSVTSMLNLGNALSNVGRAPEAEQILEEAEELARSAWGERNDDTLSVMCARGAVLIGIGKLPEARELLTRTLAGLEEVDGKEGTWTLDTLEQLGNIESQSGNYIAAEAAHRRVMETRRRIFGERHPQTLVAMSNVAETLRGAGRLKESEELTVRALDLRREVLGPEHPLTLTTQNNYVMLLGALGRDEEAAKLGEETLAARIRILGPEHPFTLTTMHNLSMEYASLKRLDDGLAMIDRCIDLRTKVLGPGHFQTLRSRLVRAQMLHRAGQVEPAERDLKSLTADSVAALGEDHSLVVEIRRYHSRCLWDLKQWVQAEEELMSMYHRFDGKIDPKDGRWLGINRNLAALYKAWGKPDEAAKYAPPSAELKP
jgi:tetratricopeptide (TPR) repeat protein